MEGLKLQPCSPGFVDGRDAILDADSSLYDGAYSDIIWPAFARRGLGIGADQGSSNSTTDGTEDFEHPIANEFGPSSTDRSFRLDGPNPFSGNTKASLTVESAQHVRVELIDMRGRRVATVFDGQLAAGIEMPIEVSARGLSPGVYVLRVEGESLSEMLSLTVVR